MLSYSRNLEINIVDGHFNDGRPIILGLEYAANIGLFIASSHSSSATNNMFPDKFWSKASGNLICSHGGKYSSSTGAGLFNIGVDNTEANAATAAYTTRLSKYDLR